MVDLREEIISQCFTICEPLEVRDKVLEVASFSFNQYSGILLMY
jgi:hypothetical protein